MEFRAERFLFFLFFLTSLALQEGQIASVSLSLPSPPPRLPLPFLLFKASIFAFLLALVRGALPLLLALHLGSCDSGGRWAGVAHGDDVCGEAVFQQDTSVSLAVQLADETVPVNHQAGAEPAGRDERMRGPAAVRRGHLRQL